MERMAMRITFDREADAAFIYLIDSIGFGGVTRTELCDAQVDSGSIILAFDEDDRLVGLEILGASRVLPNATIDSLASTEAAAR